MSSLPEMAIKKGHARDYFRSIGQEQRIAGFLKTKKEKEKEKEKGNIISEPIVEEVEVVEEETKKFTCEECGFSTDHKIALLGHMKSHKK